jgi:hypothetical protein
LQIIAATYEYKSTLEDGIFAFNKNVRSHSLANDGLQWNANRSSNFASLDMQSREHVVLQ